MADHIPAPARDYLAGLQPLWLLVRKRLEGNGLSATGVVVVDLDYQGAEDLSGLLGRAVPQGRTRIRLAELDAVLRASAIAHGLVTVVAELTGGPLVDRKAASKEREVTKLDLWAFWERAVAKSGLDAAPWIPVWRDGLRRTGLLSRAGDEAETVIRQAMAVLRTLTPTVPLASRTPGAVADAVPVESAFELAELAGAVCGDAHALDDGQLTAAVVLRAIAAATGMPLPTTAVARRELWSAVGVSPDAVSGTLLTWAVRPPGDDPWSVMMRARADLGLVTHVTAQEWRAGGNRPWVVAGQEVFACENPQVLQAAARASTSMPLLCTSGNPVTVALHALDRLIADGATVRYHGDFDVAGIQIARRLFDRGVLPWRYAAGDYLSAVASARLPLGGPVPDTPWSPGLAEAMREHRVAVHEEAVLALLLDDLSR